MIQKFTLILLTLLVSIVIHAQSYHPLIKPNAFWNYTTAYENDACFPQGPINSFTKQSYYFYSDTVIANHLYSKLYFNVIYTCGNSKPDTSYHLLTGFLREDSAAKKVFVYDQQLGVDTILYDFNLKVGDTLWSPYFTGVEFNFVTYVKSIDSVFIGGSWHKHWICSSPLDDRGCCPQIIEGIGSDQGILNDYNNQYEFEMFSLDCYSENGKALWPDTSAVCNTITGIPDIITRENLFSAFPNPFNDQIVIESQRNAGASIEIYNSMGQLQYLKFKNFQNRSSIPTGSWPAGLYEVVIRNNNQSFHSEILKQ